MSITIDTFKESIVIPLKKSVENYKNVNLFQFRSREDLNKQWDIAVGMEIAVSFIEKVYADLQTPPADLNNTSLPSSTEIKD